MKKLVTFFLALVMPIMLWAYDFRSGELFYNITSNREPYTVEVACALSSITTATIPGNVTYNGTQYSVTSIGYPAFYMCESLTSVTIPNSVTSIGNSVFYGCSSLTSITIPNSVTSIGDDAFYDCDGLTSIIIPNSVTSIGNYAFLNCDGLTSITIPNNITSIGQEVFSSCSSMTSVVWNAKSCADFSSYYDAPFYDIKSQITSFSFGDDVEYIPADLCSGMSKLISITIPNSVTSIGNYAFYGCSGLTSLTIPNSVTSIGQSAFFGCSGLTSVTLGNSVTSIGKDAFFDCDGLTSITIPNSVTSIGESAFSNCNSLTSLVWNAKSCDDFQNPFDTYDCKITSLTIGESVQDIPEYLCSYMGKLTSVVWNVKSYDDFLEYGDSPFSDYNPITSFTFGESVQHIPAYLCTGIDNLTSVTIGSNVTSIGRYAFYSCDSLTSITIPNSVMSIEECAFYDCYSLASVTIGNSVTSIGNWGFADCYALTSVTIGNSVMSIGEYAFRGSTFTSITIPSSVTSIGEHAFSNSSLDTIYVETTTPPTLGPDAFTGAPASTCYIPCSSLAAYEASDWASQVGKFVGEGCIDRTWQITYTSTNGNIVTPSATDVFGANIVSNTYENGVGTITFDGPVTTIGEKAFYNCSSLTSITIPNSVISLGNYAFYNCSFTTIAIPNGVTEIGPAAFLDCSRLTSITIPNSVTSIKYVAFGGCYQLTSMVVESANTTYDSRENCNAIIETATNTLISGCQKTIIPNSVTSIYAGAFYRYRMTLKSITIPNSVTTIGDYAFGWCSSLNSIIIPNSVTNIGDRAFYACSSLSSINIPNNVVSIGELAFYSCDALDAIYAEATTPPTLGTNAFTNTSVSTCYIPCGSLVTYEASDWASQVGEFVEDCVEGQQIIYTSTDGNIVTPYKTDVFGANIVSNTYKNGVGIITFNAPVASIGNDAFINCSSLTSITIPNGVTSIGNNAFRDCSSLTSITIPNSVTSIGGGAFRSCTSLASITIPNSVTSIGGAAFLACTSLTAITIPNSVESIGVGAFTNCYALTSLTIPNSVTSIGQRAFDGCSGLTSVTLGNSVTSIERYTFKACTSLTSITIPNSVTSIGDYAFSGCTSLSSITIPNSVTSIEEGAFYDCISLTSITIPNSVTSIGDFAFSGCTSLSSITIPNSVTSIERYTFEACTSLTSITIPNSVMSIGDYAFYDCTSLTSITIPNSVTSIEEGAFYDCISLTSITIPNGVTSIERSTFSDCSSLTSITIPNSITSIGGNAFRNCSSLTSINIPSSVTSIGDYAFWYCSYLSSITIPNSVTSIGDYAFSECTSLTSITIPNSVTSIGEWGFGDCSSLTSIAIPNSVTSIGDHAFTRCTSLETIRMEAMTPPHVGVNQWFSSPTCYIPCGSLTAYEASDWASQVGKFVEDYPYTLTISSSNNSMGSATITEDIDCETKTATIGATPNNGYHFVQWSDGNTDNPRTLTVSQDMELTAEFEKDVDPTWQIKYTSTDGNIVTPTNEDDFGVNIVSNTYKNGVGTITFNGPVTTVGYFAFNQSTTLQTVVLPNTVKSIGEAAFQLCSSLTSINIPNGLKNIEHHAFAGCSSLTDITLPNSMSSLGDHAFYSCSSLRSVELSENMTTIEGWTFSLCTSLSSITIPNSIMTIEQYAFNETAWYNNHNDGLVYANDYVLYNYKGAASANTQLEIREGTKVISSHAFYGKQNIVSVVLPNSITTIGTYAFDGCSSLASINIPDEITTIGSVTFRNTALTSIRLPESITYVGYYAFKDCASLDTIYLESSTPPDMSSEAFLNTSVSTCVIPCGTLAAYETSVWANYMGEFVEDCPIDVYYELNGGIVSSELPTNITSPFTLPIPTREGFVFVGWYDNAAGEGTAITILPIAYKGTLYAKWIDTAWQIQYTSTDGNIVNPNKIDVFGANIVSNTYENGQGVITFDGPVTSIGASAFSHCFSLNSITIPNSVTSIGSSAFQHCNSLTSVTIGNSVTSIGSSAFYNCSSLTSLTIPNSVTSIIENAFSSCSSLTSIVVEASNTTFDSRENCNAIIETETNTLIAGCQRTIIPNSITRIGDFAFYNCFSLTSITIPNSVINIGNNAFRSCSSLASITIPNSVTSIGQETFCDCSSLTSVTIGNSVKNIGGAAFFNCTKLTSITIPQGVTTIGVSAFHCCSSLASIIVEEGNTTYDSRNNCNAIIETATNTLIVGCQNTIIPNSVTSIVPSAFSWCTSLISIAIPEGVTSIGNNTFYSCFSLASVSIPSSVTSIGNDAFNHCSSLSSITIPNSVTNIGNDAFRSCSSITTVTIPNNVTSIGEGTFADCSSLISVTIGNSVTSIGRLAFYRCSSIDTIHVEATTPPTVDVEAFLSTSISTCYIPCGTLAAYQASDWANYVGEFVEECEEGRQIKYTSTDGNVVTPYDANAFGANIISNTYKDGVGTITFDAPVTSLGDLAFHQCSSLVSVTIPNTVTSIGDRAFWNCSSLSSITIPNGVESIGEFAFYYCSSLNTITFPNSVKTIGRDAFGYCTSLKKTNYIGDVIDWCDIVFITRETNPIYYSKSFYINDQEVKDLVIPNEVDSIHDYAFENCQSITSLTIGDGVKYVGTEAFSGCSSLKDVKMGKNIVDIGKQAFLSCSSLAVINIPTNVKTIGYQAFSHCTSLTEVEIPNGVTTIGHMAFNMCGSIVSVSLPKSLTSLGRLVFYECNSISKITVEEGNAKYDSRGNCNAVIETATNTLLVGSASTIIPEGIISIETAAFRGLQALTSINIPNSVTNIGEDAFYGCPLTSITIPQNVTNIGELAFRACWSLETIYVEASTPPTLGNNAFEDNSTTCYIPCGTKATYEASDWANYMGEFVETYEYTLTLLSSDNSMGSATITQEPACGTPAIIVANPNVGYHFSQWSDGNTDNPRTLTVSQDMELTAEFEKDVDPTWQIKYTSTNGNTITPTKTDVFGANIVSNVYEKGVGTITFDGPVTSIGLNAFSSCSSLTTITIPNSVTSIETYAFYKCSGLMSIIIPNCVTSISNRAFYACSALTTIVVEEGNTIYDSRNKCNAIIEISTNTLITGCQNTIIPNTVTTIGDNAFCGCSSLNSITIPNSVTTIGANAFLDCFSLTSITIPNSVTSIGSFAFTRCSSLTSIVVEGDNTKYDSRNGCNAVIETATNKLKVGCKNTIIPNSITSIGAEAFGGCSGLTSITIPNSVTSIGYDAFRECSSLTSIIIPNSVTSISSDAFRSCSSLDTIHVESIVPPVLKARAFEDTPASTCYIPCGTKAAYEASDWANYMGEFVEDCIEGQQIKYTSTDGNIVTPNKTDVFGANIVSNTYENGVGTITFDAPITKIGDEAFYNRKKLASITIPKSVETIGQYAFWDCKALTNVTISNGVMKIGGEAFRGCSALTSVVIPSSVTSIGTNPFGACPGITSIVVDENNPNFDSRNNCNGIIETSTNRLISGCQNTIIPYGVTNIDHAFWNCSSLKEITIPNTVTNIGTYTFSQCSLTSIVIPKSVTSIGDAAFINCPLSTIVVEEGNPKYDSRNHCNAIIITSTNTLLAGSDNTIIPEGITAISPNAFRGRKHIASIAIPNSVTRIGEYAFEGCTSLTSITIPDGVTAIKTFAFSSCDALTSVIIGKGVNSVEQGAFFNSPVETVYFNAQEPAIGLELVTGYRYFSTSPTCYIPCGTRAAYEASVWNDYIESFIETYEYTLTLSSSDNSMGSATITQEPACGTPAIIVATPNDGYLFSQWSDGNTDNPRTLSVTEDIKLTAQWTPNTNIPYIVNHYRQALDGTYPSTLKETENLMGTTAANVTPVVNTYTGFTSPEAKRATIAADGSTVVEYYYTRNQYTLTWVTDGNALTGAYSKGSVLFEAAITIPNTPTKTDYTFAGWDNTVPVTMPAEDVTLTALFTIHTYSVILTADQNGTVSGGGTYNYGESVTITATPNDGYTFSQWSDGNTDNPRTLTVTEDIELTAEFEEEGNYGSYTRTVRIGYNTICLPHGSSNFTGATFYEIAHILKNKKKIFFDEVKTLEAGKPYIFYPHSTEVTIYYDNTTSAIPLSHNGLHGTFDGITAASNFLKGKYLVAGDRMVLCGDGCSLAANRAYIVLDEISDKDHPAIPGIKRVSMDYSEENATTALDNITDETIVAPIQEGVYDILGRKVDAPTVSGFYIINGKKVFVMEK